MTSEPVEKQRFGDYDVESTLGRGSVGMVYLARHRRLNRLVALKVMQFSQTLETDADRLEFEARLQREAELCASLLHPNVVTLYEAGYDGDVLSYLATEYVDGETLLARLKRQRPIPLLDALSVSADLLRGLAYAHSKQIIHRDVKPANIFLTSSGQAKIGDFGVARPVQSNLTMSGSLIGTPNYMSPEQVRSVSVSTKADLFSSGVVMYEMLTGLRPFAAPELSGILFNVVQLEPQPAHKVNPEVPEAISIIVSKLMAKSPAERYDTADEALADLERARAVLAPVMARAASYDTTTPLPTQSQRELSQRATLIQEIPEEPEELTKSALLPGNETIRNRKTVAPWLFWLVVVALIAGLAGAVWQIRVRTPVGSTAEFAPGQEKEREEKERALAVLRAQYAAGNLEAAIKGYDAFIEKWPTSLVAQKERDDAASTLAELQLAAQQAAEQAQASPASKSVKSAKARGARTPSDSEETGAADDAKKPSRWQRVKRWFRADPPKTTTQPPEKKPPV